MVTAYSFGRIVVDGREYRKDLIILADGSVYHPWWRGEGHSLTHDDMEAVMAAPPDIVVVGTGAYGRMSADKSLLDWLESAGVTLKLLPTDKAVAEYNSALESGKKVAACLHLTC